MSSTLRSTAVPVGYFVMSADSVIGGYGRELFKPVVVDGVTQYWYDLTISDDLAAGDTFTWRDLGLTVYGASVRNHAGTLLSNPTVDLRKVTLVSRGDAALGATEKMAPRYVPLGTNLKSSTPFEPATTKSSVFLVGKIL